METPAFDYLPKPKVVFGPGTVERLGELAKAEGFLFSDFGENPDTAGD